MEPSPEILDRSRKFGAVAGAIVLCGSAAQRPEKLLELRNFLRAASSDEARRVHAHTSHEALVCCPAVRRPRAEVPVAGGEAEVPNAALHILAGFGFQNR